MVNWARLVKSDAEINLMKKAAVISEKAMKKAWNVLILVLDKMMQLQKFKKHFLEEHQIWRRICKYCNFLPTGKGTSASHLTSSDEKFVNGEATIIELSGVNKRYHAPMARTVFLENQIKKK